MGAGSTSFPTDLDTNVEADGTTEISSGGFNDHSVQIEAIEAKVGKDSSATTTSHDYKLSGVATGTKAVSLTGTETLTNKTLTTPLVDTINEKTAANGVTIDSLNIKDGKLNTNNSVVTANITDANVTLAKIAAEAWTSYTPTWTAITGTPSLGNGTLTGYYVKIGRTVHGWIQFTWGSTTSSAGATSWLFALPVNNATGMSGLHQMIGTSYIEDSGTVGHIGTAKILITQQNKINIEVSGASSTYVSPIAISATVPFTWTTGDYLTATFTYESAS